MSVTSRSILEGLQIGKTLGEPIARGYERAAEQDFQKKQQEERFRDQMAQLAIMHPELGITQTPSTVEEGIGRVFNPSVASDKRIADAEAGIASSIRPTGVAGFSVDQGAIDAENARKQNQAEKNLTFEYGLRRQLEQDKEANKPFTLSQGEERYSYNKETGKYEKTAGVLPKGVVDKPFTLGKGDRLVDASGKVIAENPSDAPKPLIVPAGSAVIDAEGNEKFKNDKPETAAKPPTEGQSAYQLYGKRMEESNKAIEDLNFKPVEGAEYLPNRLKGEDRQKFEQSQRDFINAALRKESGAAISPSEFQNAQKQYFPQAGDSEDVLRQKKANRALVIAEFKRLGGESGKTSDAPSGQGSLSKEQAQTLLETVGGDKEKARELAKKLGYSF